MSVAEAARDIALTEYESWTEPERIYVDVAAIYRHLGATEVPASVVAQFAVMAQIGGARSLRAVMRKGPIEIHRAFVSGAPESYLFGCGVMRRYGLIAL